MKKIFIISIFYLFSTNILIADEHKCSGMKKLSKEYLACTAKNIKEGAVKKKDQVKDCLLYTSPSPRDKRQSRMPSSA